MTTHSRASGTDTVHTKLYCKRCGKETPHRHSVSAVAGIKLLAGALTLVGVGIAVGCLWNTTLPIKPTLLGLAIGGSVLYALAWGILSGIIPQWVCEACEQEKMRRSAGGTTATSGVAATAQPRDAVRYSALAIWSLVLSLLAIVLLCAPTAIAGIVCGHIAMSKIKHSPNPRRGWGLALAGAIIGYAVTALTLLIIAGLGLAVYMGKPATTPSRTANGSARQSPVADVQAYRDHMNGFFEVAQASGFRVTERVDKGQFTFTRGPRAGQTVPCSYVQFRSQAASITVIARPTYTSLEEDVKAIEAQRLGSDYTMPSATPLEIDGVQGYWLEYRHSSGHIVLSAKYKKHGVDHTMTTAFRERDGLRHREMFERFVRSYRGLKPDGLPNESPE